MQLLECSRLPIPVLASSRLIYFFVQVVQRLQEERKLRASTSGESVSTVPAIDPKVEDSSLHGYAVREAWLSKLGQWYDPVTTHCAIRSVICVCTWLYSQVGGAGKLQTSS